MLPRNFFERVLHARLLETLARKIRHQFGQPSANNEDQDRGDDFHDD
jgi:hypothetical protein